MKITIDCRFINSSGIGVYAKECLSFMLNSNNQFLLLGRNNELNLFAEYKNAEILDCNIRPFSLHETFFFSKTVLNKINNGDIYYSPYFNIPCGIKIPVYTTIHDIIFPDMPELTSFPGLKIRMFFYRRCFRLSKKIFTVSNFSKSRIEYYSKGKKPVIVTQNALQSYFLENNKPEINSANKDYILFIGNLKKHKGLDCLLDAFYRAKQDGLKQTLIIIGNLTNLRSKDSAFHNKLSSFKQNEVIIYDHVSDNELKKLLTNASLLVQPSLYEGFGIPPLEAMFMGTMALISDIPVFREIYGDFPVVFFKAGDSFDLREKLLFLLLHNKPRKISLSKELIEKYSYKKTADIILKEMSN